MLRFLKQFVWLAGLILGCQSVFGFALLGPVPAAGTPDIFQTPDIGFALPGDPGTPKAIGDEYRRNTPVLYYSFDATFLNFFGPDGAAEVDKAMAIYNGLTNVSTYSPDLSEFALDTRRVNFRAAAASLMDLKSTTMGLLTEQLGFWEPTRWVWALHGRLHLPAPAPPCPAGMEYLVFQRNYDIVPSAPDVYQTSSYVNGVLYSYFIDEVCTPPNPLADALEFPVDPLSQPFSAVADFTSLAYEGLVPGMFYTGLTRDDVGGLRYLIRTNNFNIESAGDRTTEFLTNSPTFIVTQDLNVFAAEALTNNAAGLIALNPGLIINTTSNFFGFAITTNITETLKNKPLDPAGLPPTHPFFTTNYTTNVVNFFQHTFANNFITNSFSNRGLVGTLSLGLTNAPLSPAGTPPTIVTNTRISLANGVFGDFFILPTNFCSAQILSNILTQVIVTTNFPGTNAVVGGTNSVTFTPGSISFFTNHTVAYLPVTCPLDTVATREGVERIRFIRRDYDSLINQAWDPVTNDYTLVELTNSALIPRHMQRRVPRPDLLFSVADLTANAALSYSNTVDGVTTVFTFTLTGFGLSEVLRTVNFNANNRPPNSAGPGTMIDPPVLPTLIVFNKIGPLFLNSDGNFPTNAAPAFLSESTQLPLSPLSWGSFDGTTNAPTVYPNGSSIAALENLLTGPAVTTSTLPTTGIGSNYSAQLAAVGGVPPYTWALAPNSPSLPTGLNLSSSGLISGMASGPAAVYDFTVRVTDSANTFRDITFTISVF